MDTATFDYIVAEDVKGRVTPAQADFLRLPENLSRWQRALVDLVARLDGQLTNHDARLAEKVGRLTETLRTVAADPDATTDDIARITAAIATRQAEHEQKCNSIRRFRNHVEARLDEVTRTIVVGAEVIDERVAQVQFLRRAIDAHRALIAEADLEPTAADVALWAVLDGRWGFDGVTAADLDRNAA